MLITNFASGELSANLNGRVDIQQYYQGAATIKNFEIIPTGGIKRRVGTKRCVALSGNDRIIPFIIDKNKVYVLELGLLNPTRTLQSLEEDGEVGEYAVYTTQGITYYEKYFDGAWNEINRGLLKIWTRGVTGMSNTQTIDNCPWNTTEEIKTLQYAQNYSTMIFVNAKFRPYILELQGLSFAASEMQFDFSPDVSLDDDFDYVMIVYGSTLPEKGTTAKGEVQFTYRIKVGETVSDKTKVFPDSITDYYCVVEGKLYKWNVSEWQPVGTDNDAESGLFTTTDKYPSCVAFFNNRLFFAATNQKPQKIWASAAPDETGEQYNVFSTYRKYVTVNKVVKDADLHVFSCNIAQADIDTTNNQTVLRFVSQDFTAEGTLKEAIGKYYVSSQYLPVGTKVLSVTENTMTINTSSVNIAFDSEHTVEENCVMSLQLWKTADSASAEDYEYMVVSNNVTTADCSLFFELASDQNDAIKFLSANSFLAAGTESSIWSIGADISAVNISAAMQGRYGSDDIQAQAVETATVYFAQGKKGIREFYYDGNNAAFRTNNIALLAEHLLRESAAVDFDYMTNPYSRLIIVREDGKAVCMLYDKTNGIMAWNRLELGHGLIKSCAVTRGYDENDLVYFVVKDGNDYYLEELDYGTEVYLDEWKVYDSSAQDPAAGYGAGAILWNKTKNITCPYDSIPSGFISTNDDVYIGYAFESYIKSLPVVAGQLHDKKRIGSLWGRFLNSYLPVVKCTGLPDEKFSTVKEKPYSGVAKINYPGKTERDVCFEMMADDVAPVNILSVEAELA